MNKHTDLPSIADQPVIYSSNRMEQVVSKAIEEILGREGVNELFNLADLPEHIIKDNLQDGQDRKFSLTQISHLQAGLETAYGTRVGRGLAMRIGRVCFKHSLAEFGSELGFSDLSFRLLPLQAKLKNSNEAFAALFNTITDQQVRLLIEEKSITWQIEHCPLCQERYSDVPCCHLAVGWLQEALFWVSGGKYFQVEEQKCIASGDRACTIIIDRAPLG